MCRKAIFTTIAIALGLLVLSQTRVGNKVCGLAELAWNKIGFRLNKAVPIDWEISRIDNEIAKLDKDIKRHFDTLAEETVKGERMKKDVEVVRTNLKDRLQVLEIMKRDLKANTQKIMYNDREYTRSQIENKFANDWKAYRVAEKGLEVKEKRLKQQQDYVDAFNTKIKTMENARDTLKTEVLRLRTEVEEVRASQNQCRVQIDDSRLAEIKKSLADVQDTIDVMKKRAEFEGASINIPVENKVEANKALEEFETRFGDHAKVSSEEK